MAKKPITEGYDKRTIKPQPQSQRPATPPPSQKPSGGSGGKSGKK